MPQLVPDGHRLLLFFKDQAVGDALAASPLASKSSSIEEHVALVGVDSQHTLTDDQDSDSHAPRVVADQLSFLKSEPPPLDLRCPRELSSRSCVWGWWRKPWEQHADLLQLIQDLVRNDKPLKVLLYNQYARRLFTATLTDVYFEPDLTTVLVPRTWALRCPEYYRSRSHLCGAFFALDIDSSEANPTRIESLFIDARSLLGLSQSAPCIIPPPQGLREATHLLIDAYPTRRVLRSAELSLMLLREFPQIRETTGLLQSGAVTDAELARSFNDTSWDDLMMALRESTPSTWRLLANSPQSVSALGARARLLGVRSTRLDFELVAHAVDNHDLSDLLVDAPSARFTPLGRTLVRWVTDSSEASARESAKTVFAAAWRWCQARYGFAPLPAEYFDALPAIEMIANAVKHHIKGKFYRDHLSHNVRAALLSARLTSSASLPRPLDMHNGVVAFLSGLLHDLAMPVTGFPALVASMADTIARAQPRDDARQTRFREVAGLLDRDGLKRSLSYVAMLAAVPQLPEAFTKEQFTPWAGMQHTLDGLDRDILVEELLCAASAEHAIVSAALLFEYAVRGELAKQQDPRSYDAAVRTVLSTMTGRNQTAGGLELRSILQAVALHDRRPAAEHPGDAEPPPDSPKALDLARFAMPAMVAVADELQEWGRTIGTLDDVAATDARIALNSGHIDADFALNTAKGVFERVPFSILEYVFGKVRGLSRLRVDENPAGASVSVRIGVSELGAFAIKSAFPWASSAQMDFDSLLTHVVFDDGRWTRVRLRQIEPAHDAEVLNIVAVGSKDRARDFLVIEGVAADVQLAVGHLTSGSITRLIVDGQYFTIECRTGETITFQIVRYAFGKLGSRSGPSTHLPIGEEVGVLVVRLKSSSGPTIDIATAALLEPQSVPAPHILDFDWRFTADTCRAIATHARRVAAAGRIVYLGCPSVALWHHRLWQEDANWFLYDCGHFALHAWCATGAIPEERWVHHDVFKEPPTGDLHDAAVVIADPPWHDPYYERFCLRAYQLLRTGGVFGVTHYPKAYDVAKFDWFRTQMSNVMTEFEEYGALEVAYVVPPFEAPSRTYVKYTHSALGLYRPGYMDFYRAPTTWKSRVPAGRSVRSPLSHGLTELIALDDSHHMKCLPPDVLAGRLPTRVALREPQRADRVREVPATCLAWSSDNLMVVEASDGQEVKTLEDITALLNHARSKRGAQDSKCAS